jgi:hypothetical protein
MNLRPVLFLVTCLLASGCDDSKNPLSDPNTSKADERLIGIWREAGGGDEVYYHVGRAGGKFPSSVMRIVAIRHSRGQMEPPEEYLVFPTIIGDKTCLNLVWDGDKGQVKRLNEKGWKADVVDNYTFLRYQIDGDKLIVYLIDEEAKQKAVQGGKIKGVIGKNLAQFTDTTEKLARFVVEAGDRLWDMKEPGRLERVGFVKKP